VCPREGISQSLYYKWTKEFPEAGKCRLSGDTTRAVFTVKVIALRREARELKEVVANQTFDKLGIPRTTFYRWYYHYQAAGQKALEDQSPRPLRVWNRIPDDVRQRIVNLTLDVPELSSRERAVRFTDTEKHFVFGDLVYRPLKFPDLIASPAFIFIKAVDGFRDKNTAIN